MICLIISKSAVVASCLARDIVVGATPFERGFGGRRDPFKVEELLCALGSRRALEGQRLYLLDFGPEGQGAAE